MVSGPQGSWSSGSRRRRTQQCAWNLRQRASVLTRRGTPRPRRAASVNSLGFSAFLANSAFIVKRRAVVNHARQVYSLSTAWQSRGFLLQSHRRCRIVVWEGHRERFDMAEVWQGTLALMVLKTLDTLGP